MIHAGAFVSDDDVAAPPVSIDFDPNGGFYTGTSLGVLITVTGAAKLRWKIDTGSWTTVNGLSAVVTVSLIPTGKTLYCDALDSGGAVLLSHNETYFRDDGGN